MDIIRSSEITPEHIYLARRKFIAGVGALVASMLFLDGCRRLVSPSPSSDYCRDIVAGNSTDDLGDPLTPCDAITHYNNFYEFSLEKDDVADQSQNFKTSPWTVRVGGLVNKPKAFDIDDLQRKFPPEERIYRLRCVEGWSMVVPWFGFPLARLLKEVEPKSNAKYVRFETLLDSKQMPLQRTRMFTWPYVEGLRLDEAMHELTFMATGIYGNPLPPQNGAPIRLVVPWKYGFKNIKSIVKIDLVEEMPVSFWMDSAANEYGFYANVNPEVPHPRWSQSSERRIGQLSRIETLLFNGYTDKVAGLYEGMDLRKFY